MRALARSRHDGRLAISAQLRALAAFIALLLSGSSLAQTVHFLLIPHAICAEHGELVELGGQADAHHEPHEASRSVAISEHGEADAGHDHCEVLARSERELSLPPIASFELPAAPRSLEQALPVVEESARHARPLLDVAPKTSPPTAA